MIKQTLTLLAVLLLAPPATNVRAGEAQPITGVFVDVARIRHDAQSWGERGIISGPTMVSFIRSAATAVAGTPSE